MSDPGSTDPLEVYRRNLEVYELNQLFPERTFVSHWDIDDSELAAISARLHPEPTLDAGSIGKYQFLAENKELHAKVRQLHRAWEAIEVPHLVLGDGGSPLITAFLLWMRSVGLDTLHYVPPVYYTFHKLASLVGIHLRPVSGTQGFEEGYAPNLPRSGGILYVADPIWYVGRRHHASHFESLARWQEESGGTVFVDGSFQFMAWDGTRRERCVRLLPERTFRLISPTKSMTLHGLRFAYLVCPTEKIRTDINWIYEDSHGPSSVANHRIASALMDAVSGSPGNGNLMRHAEQQFDRLRASGKLSAWIEPECGNFAFLQIASPGPDWLGLSADHFETKGYPGYMRVNLLNGGIVRSILDL